MTTARIIYTIPERRESLAYFATRFHGHLKMRLGQCSWFLTATQTVNTTLLELSDNEMLITYSVFHNYRAVRFKF